MKRLLSVLLILSLLVGFAQQVISPSTVSESNPALQSSAVQLTAAPSLETTTPAPTETPRPALATFVPKGTPDALFPEELISLDGEPVGSAVRALLDAQGFSKAEYYDRFTDIIAQIESLDASLLRLADIGRTLAEDRKQKTVKALGSLMSDEILVALQNAYSACSGEGEALPVKAYASSMSCLLQDVQRIEGREVPFFGLGADTANDYRTVLARYMGEPVIPQDVFAALELLMQAEAYALGAALTADPEAARKKEPITYGSFEQNMTFLCQVARDLCAMPDNIELPIPPQSKSFEKMELPELAFRLYPGMAFLKIYAAQETAEQRARWDNAPEGYLAGLAVHCSYAVVPYLSGFGLDYVLYRWYEDMLYTTMTGMTALLIHYYGYTEKDLADYLQGWGAASFADELYQKAMFDPFESLVASYGYYRYLDICQAALDAGCESETRFFRDYLDAGPAPYAELKEYMVGLYSKQG